MARHKFSHQREAIKEALLSRTDHPSAEMLHEGLRRDYPNLSLGTVYRNLSLLVESGDAKKVYTDSGTLRFDGNMKPHSHFICHRCGSIKDLYVQYDDALTASAEKASGEIIDDCVVTYFGICGCCRGETS